MKTLTYLLAGVLVLCGMMSPAPAQDINLTGYNITFDDEFNSLSATTTSPKGSANWYAHPLNSAGYYSESTWDINALSVSGGILSDKAFLDSSNNWHSGELLSVDPTGAGFSQTYGYFEIRCQMPNSGDGAWPAFWLDTTSGITGGANEEIDIFEWYGICNTAGSYQDLVQQTSHNWNADGSQNTTTAPYLPSTSTAIPNGTYPWQGYHIYGCLIDPVHMTWYIDGVQTNQCATPTTYLATPFFVQLDYALGGGWPLSGMVNNSSFNIDWVRVYSLPPTYALTVNNGTGSGSYASGATVTVSANAPQSGYQFAGWTGATSALANPSAATTTLAMPAAATSITATYSLINGGNLISNGTYKIVSQSSSLALATTGTTNGSSVVQQTYTSAATQQWTLTNLGNNVVELVSSGTSEALEVPGSSTSVGTDLDVSSYTEGTNQQWTIATASTGYYEIVNVNSGDEVNVAGNSTTSGAAICQWFAGNYGNGVWSFTTVSPPTYALTVTNGTGSGNYTAGTAVTVTANAPQSGYQFAGWTGATSDLANPSAGTTTFTMPAAAASITATYSAIGSNLIANGTYKINSQSSGLSLATTGTTNGSSVVQQTYTSAAAQQWSLTNLGSNVVELVSSGTSEALEVPGSSTNVGTDLDVSSYTGGTNQQWTIVSASTGYYEIVNVNSGDEANVAGNSTTSGSAICQWFAGNYGNGVWSFTLINAPATYALTVNSGTGSGSYTAGTVVSVSANTAPSGEQFSAWTGTTSALASTTSATTTLTMPAAATSITATYSSTGGGSNLISNGTYKVVSQSSSLALATSGTTSGSSVVQQTYTATNTQQWTLTNLGSNVVKLINVGASDALEAPGSTTANGAALDISSYTGGTNQQWTIGSASSGYYEVVNVNSGLEVNVAYNSTSPGATICQYTAGNYGNGVWTFLSP